MSDYAYGSTEDMNRDSHDPANLVIIGMLSPPRPNFRMFMSFLEYRYFPPGDPLNDKFRLALVNFEEMIFGVITIPSGSRDKAELVARECGLRLVDGVPMVFGAGPGGRQFPINGPQAWTIESEPKSDVYKGMNSAQEMLEREKEVLEKFFEDEKNSKN